MPLEFNPLDLENSVLALVAEMSQEINKAGSAQAYISEMTDKIKENPTDSKLYLKKAIALQQIGTRESFDELVRGEQNCGEDYRFNHFKGICYVRQSEVYRTKARTLEKIGQKQALKEVKKELKEWYAKAIKEFKKALEIQPNAIEVLYTLGTVYNRAEEYNNAIFTWNQVLEINPEDPQGWNGKAKAEYHAEDYENALKHSNAALLSLTPDNMHIIKIVKKGITFEKLKASYHVNRTGIKLAIKDIEGAMQDLETAYSLAKIGISEFKDIGMNYVKEEKFEKAIEVFERIQKISPDFDGDHTMYMAIAGLYHRIGKPEKIDEVFKDLETVSSEEKALDLKGITLMNVGMFKEALDNYEYIYAKTGRKEFVLNIVQICQILGDQKKAVKYLNIIGGPNELMRLLREHGKGIIIPMPED